jgi:hypothetical protein
VIAWSEPDALGPGADLRRQRKYAWTHRTCDSHRDLHIPRSNRREHSQEGPLELGPVDLALPPDVDDGHRDNVTDVLDEVRVAG